MNLTLYKTLSKIILEKTGILYKEEDYFRLTSRINKIIEQNNLTSEKDLLDILSTDLDSKFLEQIIDIATNNESSFFRDKKPFLFLENELIPYFKQKNIVNLKVWSAACSSGQEPISILISMLEKANGLYFSIDATDISQTILEKAKKGIYTGLEVQRGLPIQQLVKYFEKFEENKWKLKSEYLNRLNYQYLNLINPPLSINKYHIIFCRNILIYQSLENRTKILSNLYNLLHDDGVIILGSGESLSGVENKFVLSKGELYNCYTKKKIAFQDLDKKTG